MLLYGVYRAVGESPLIGGNVGDIVDEQFNSIRVNLYLRIIDEVFSAFAGFCGDIVIGCHIVLYGRENLQGSGFDCRFKLVSFIAYRQSGSNALLVQ